MRFHAIMIVAAAAAFVCATSIQAAIAATYTGTPYSGDTINGKPHQIPGIIKSVFFDEGGPDVAFHETTTENRSNLTMRKNSAVDLPADMQPFQFAPRPDFNIDGTLEPLGSWHLSWIDPGEWVKFTVHVNTAGVYYVSLKVSMVSAENLATISFNDGKTCSIKNLKTVSVPRECTELDRNKYPELDPDPKMKCEIYHMWAIYNNVDSMALDTGLFVLTYKFDKGEQNFDWIKFTLKSATAAKTRSTLQTNQAIDLAAAISGSKLNVAYSLPRPGAARLSVVDCAGRRIFNSQTADAAGGRRRVSLQLPTRAKGLYFIRIDQGEESATAIVPVLR
jgi:hypothetical protein